MIQSLLPGLSDLWGLTTGRPEIRVAVLDGHVDLSHSVFEGASIEIASETGSAISADRQGAGTVHGTRTSSILFGQHGSAAPGVAPGCTGLIVPVLQALPGTKSPVCSQLELAHGIGLAIQKGAHIINISAGQLNPSGVPELALEQALRNCREAGVLVIAAAGNDGCDCLHIPASDPSVVAVGATTKDGQPLEQSNWGAEYLTNGILALGENVLSATPGGNVSPSTGTSWAAPIVSGVAALLLSHQLDISQTPDAQQARELLFRSAKKCQAGEGRDCRRFLAGQLDIPNLLKFIRQGNPTVEHEEQQVLVSPSEQLPREMSTEQTALAEPVTASAAPEAETIPPALPTSEASNPAAVTASGCSCDSEPPSLSLAYAFGAIGFDYGTEARMDSFVQAGLAAPHDPAALAAFLRENPVYAASLTWTLTQDTTPIYVIRAGGAFAESIHKTLRLFLEEQLAGKVERVSVPGLISGTERLSSGQNLPVLWPELRGMFNWSTEALVESVRGAQLNDSQSEADAAAIEDGVFNFLERIYYEIRNLGLAPQERALNFAATNAFQVERTFHSAAETGMHLDDIGVERSPICRPGSDCWDVKMMFFNPQKRLEQARHVYRFTIDVSDIIPVTVGKIRHWSVY